MRDLENRVRKLAEEHVFEHGCRLAEVRETLSEKIAEVARELDATAYETEQAKWLDSC